MYKNTKIRALCIALSVIMALTVISACNGAEETDDDWMRDDTSPGELEGEIVIAMPMGPHKPVYESVAQAYMDIHPNVNVIVDDKAQEFYNSWINAQIASGDPSGDVVNSAFSQQYYAQNKFVDYNEYLNRENPYADDMRWRDVMDSTAYRPNGPNNEVFALDLDMVQVTWFYNMDIFEEVGVEPPETWDDLLVISQQIKDAGYIPLAVPGSAENFWGEFMGWIIQSYADQYFRDLTPLWVVQPGDYNFDPELHGDWEYDPDDIFNDAPENITVNVIRLLRLLRDGEIGPDSDKWRDMYANLAKAFPRFAPDDFFALVGGRAGDYFIQNEAAMFMHITTAYFGMLDYFVEHPDESFEIGFFWPPPMTGEHVAVDFTRSVGGPTGAISILTKTQAENDLNADFMMFYASPMGQIERFDAIERMPQIVPAGIPLVKDVEVPEEWQNLFDNVGIRGQASLNYGEKAFSRGLFTEQTSVRAFQNNAHAFFMGNISLQEFSERMQQALVDAIPLYLQNQGYREDALDDPSRDPAAR